MLGLHSRLLDRLNYSYSDSCDAITAELKIPYFNTVSNNLQKPGIFSLNKLLVSMRDAHERVSDNPSILHIFNTFYLYENKEFGSYFRNLYQTLKLIQNSFSDIAIQKKYSNILRAQLSNQELSLLLLNCLCPYVDHGQFKELVIHFELLEHLDITYNLGDDNIATFTINNPTLNLTSNEIDQYFSTDTSGKLIKSAFGQNFQIMDYCKFKNLVDQ